jgi:hypothetical protein
MDGTSGGTYDGYFHGKGNCLEGILFTSID